MSTVNTRLAAIRHLGWDVVIRSDGAGWSCELAVAGVVKHRLRAFDAEAVVSCAFVVAKRAMPAGESMCPLGKRIFVTEEAAEESATSLTRNNLRYPRAEGRTAARAYKCDRCPFWHTTSQAPRKRTRPDPTIPRP